LARVTKQRKSRQSSKPKPPSTQAATDASRPSVRNGVGGMENRKSSRKSAVSAGKSTSSVAFT
jgi:hypothetical protein